MFRTLQVAATGCSLAVIVLAMHGTAFAQRTSIKPGLWEIEQVFEIPGAPDGGFKSKWQHCVTEEDAKQGPVLADAYANQGTPKRGECRVENIRYPERGRVTYDVVCGDPEYRIKVEYRYTETTFEGTSRTVSREGSITYKLKGRYVGPCKKDGSK
jgi:hypothetical protein